MFKNNSIENLELRLQELKEENEGLYQKIEKDFEEKYIPYLEKIFQNDNLAFKRYISAYFQIGKMNSGSEDREVMKQALQKTMEYIPLSSQKKEQLYVSLLKLEAEIEVFQEKMVPELDIKKDVHFPILEALVQDKTLDMEDVAHISIEYKSGGNFLESIGGVSKEKRDIIREHYFHLNNTNSNEKIEQFEHDFRKEIQASKYMKVYPNALKFVGRNYFKLRLKNKTESKKERLRRMFKIAFLKLYRLKYSGIDINSILEQIETYSDLDDMLLLLIKFFEVLKHNPTLQQDYVVMDELETATNLVEEAEYNKEQELFSEENTVNATKLLEELEGHLYEDDLEKILSDEVDLVGEEFVDRVEKNAGILAEGDEKNKELESEGKEKKEEVNLRERFEELQGELLEIEEKKRKLFLEAKYEEIDELNEELILLIQKLEKFKKLLGISDDEDDNEESEAS